MSYPLIYAIGASITFIIGARVNRGEPNKFGNTLLFSVFWPVTIPGAIAALIIAICIEVLETIYRKLSTVPPKQIKPEKSKELVEAEQELSEYLEG